MLLYPYLLQTFFSFILLIHVIHLLKTDDYQGSIVAVLLSPCRLAAET